MKKLLLMLLLFLTVTGMSQIPYTFSAQPSDFQITTEQSYTTVKSQESSEFTTEVGAPQLPIIKRNFVLPAGSVVTNINFTNSSSTLIADNVTVFPVQHPQDWVTDHAFVSPSSIIYNSLTSYPANTVIKTVDENTQGYHIVTLDICPFSYIPGKKKLYLYQNITINIQYNVGSIEYQERITVNRNELNKDWVSSIVSNPSLLSSINGTAKTVINEPTETDKLFLHWKPSAYGDVPDFIIVTNESFKSHFKN